MNEVISSYSWLSLTVMILYKHHEGKVPIQDYVGCVEAGPKVSIQILSSKCKHCLEIILWIVAVISFYYTRKGVAHTLVARRRESLT
jgi:hypothetical protein